MVAVRWILLIWLGTVVVSTFLVGCLVLWHRHALQREAWRLQAAFDALSFDTPNGALPGEALTVVKIAYRLEPDGTSTDPAVAREHWDSLWYAAGPGPSYFLAICTADAGEPSHASQWRVRRLDESHMRAALSGDVHAQMLAFGDAIEA